MLDSPLSESLVLEVHKEWDRIPELFHATFDHLSGAGALDVPGELLEGLDEALDTIHQVVHIQVSPKSLSPFFTSSLKQNNKYHCYIGSSL